MLGSIVELQHLDGMGHLVNFDSAYKQVRNKLRRYYPESIVQTSLSQLQTPKESSLADLQNIPWQALLTVKWCLQDSMAGSQSKGDISTDELLRIRNKIWNIPEILDKRLIGEQPLRLMMRQLLHAQVEFQKPITKSVFREAAIIDSLGENHYLYRVFEEKTGLTPSDFLDFTFATYAIVLKGGLNFRIDQYADSISHRFTKEKTDTYITLVSLNYSELVNFFRCLPDAKSKRMSELWEFPILARYPFYRSNGVMRCWHKAVFHCGSAGMVHTILGEDGSDYIERYSKIFESHCVDLARHAGGTHYTDADLKAMLPIGCKNPDAMLSFDDCNIFVEVKSGLFGPNVMSVGNREIFRHKTRALGAAIQQAWEASDGLRLSSNAPISVQNADIEFLLVVTNKELSSGRGSDLKDIYPDGTIIEPDAQTSNRLPLSRVYVVSIEDYERLMMACKLEEISLPAFLRSCERCDDDSATRKFYMEQHLTEAEVPVYVSELVSRAFESSSARLQDV